MTSRVIALGMGVTNVLALAMACQTAQAQAGATPEQEANTTIQDVIVVTARRIEENVQTVPVSITALSGAALERQGARVVADLQTQVPNLTLQTHPSEPQALAVTIRGQKQNDIVPTVDPSVGIYVDGVYLPRTVGLRGGLVDVDRVEVLRGPQGTLYGRNTTGGAISLYTKNPTDAFEGMVSGTYGNYDYAKLTGMLNAPLAQGLSLRIAGEYTRHDGYGRDGEGRELASEDGYYIRGKLKAELTDNITAIISASHENNDSGGGIWKITGVGATTPEIPVGLLEVAGELGLSLAPANVAQSAAAARAALLGYVGGNPYRTDGTFPSFSKFRRSTAGLDLNFELSDDIRLRSITGYQDYRRLNAADFDGTPFNIIEAETLTRDKYFSQELQLLGGDEHFNWVLGAYYGREKALEIITNVSVPLLNPAAPSVNRADIVNQSEAVFAQANWEFVPKVRLTLGARYSWDQRDNLLNNRTAAGCVIPAPGVTRTPTLGPSQCPRAFDVKFNDPSWLVSFDYRPTQNTLFYAKVARGYRTGGINKLGANTVETFGAFDPESVTEYEAGLKTELFDSILRFNLSAYYDDYKNIQRSVTVPTLSGTPAILVSNAARGRIQGFEAETTLRITPEFRLNGSAGLTDAKYKTFIDLTGDRSNEPFSTPKWTGSVSAFYENHIGPGKLNVNLDYHWQSKAILEPTAIQKDTVTQKAYGLLNGRIGYELMDRGVNLALFGRNLTDKAFYSSGATYETSLGINRLVTGEPRTYGIEVTKRF